MTLQSLTRRLTFSAEHAVDKVTLVVAPILPLIATFAVFLSLKVVAFEFDFALAPGFAAVSVLQVVHPFAFVSRSLGVNERAVAICHSVCPLTLVCVTICLSHATLTRHLVVAELAFVLRTVCPCQYSKSIFDHSSIDVCPE